MDRRARQMSHLLDAFGQPSTNPSAWWDRFSLDRWATALIEGVRTGSFNVDQDSVVQNMADLRDEHEHVVDAKTAGIELQNLTRPTVAVARFAAFAAAALVEHPQWAQHIHAAVDNAGGQLHDIPEALLSDPRIRISPDAEDTTFTWTTMLTRPSTGVRVEYVAD
ncbi:hypothetical protein [Corynebacterium heidelbergense]|uniref:Uncharacterized protein n=1 Tax=Corynebacterium heidelbergense TaxID=2055947 RepID=A0A364VAL3_9CORY|nr:hypothetical protein [Corynebacterium heidelbergense]RAV33606.1 hypothetical protein CWC39_07620 [Corynebacterium heidelbergense]WCZ36499.1 Fatty-acid peroxygenase [Corynebacterium heidelbergense]